MPSVVVFLLCTARVWLFKHRYTIAEYLRSFPKTLSNNNNNIKSLYSATFHKMIKYAVHHIRLNLKDINLQWFQKTS